MTRPGLQLGIACTLLPLGVLISCSDGPTVTEATPRSPSITVVSGDRQSGEVGTRLAAPITLRVRHSTGAPAANVTLTFTGDGRVEGDSAVTDAAGLATVFWILGSRATAQALHASARVPVPPLGTQPTARVVANALAGPAASVALVEGDSSVVLPGTEIDVMLHVRDRYGNSVRDLPVTWNVPANAGKLGAVWSQTDTGGRARGAWTIGSSLGAHEAVVQTGPISTRIRAVANGPLAAAAIAGGERHTCALTPSGVAYCWGFNIHGQLGLVGPLRRRHATRVPKAPAFVQVVAGEQHTCGRTAAGAVYCWGYNLSGQLGARVSMSFEPLRVAGTLSFTQLTAGARHTCGLTSDSAAYCWGANDVGQLGDQSFAGRSAPVRVKSAVSFSAIAAGADFTCALTGAGESYCWGSDASFALASTPPAACITYDYYYGPVSTGCSSIPLRTTLHQRLTALAAGSLSVCAIAENASVTCWGFYSKLPRLVAGVALQHIAVGRDACGTTPTGGVVCWSLDPVSPEFLAPRANDAPAPLQVLTSGHRQFCGIAAVTGIAYCWGDNWYGQLGDGTTRERRRPVAVVAPLDP